MNKVRKEVMDGIAPYVDFSKHRDLVAFTVGADYFSYDYETDTEIPADFFEIVAVVEKDWLFRQMKKADISNPLEYLQDEYTWDDSFEWFQSAKIAGKVIAVEFN